MRTGCSRPCSSPRATRACRRSTARISAIADVDGLRERAERARSFGYDGKWALHPGQIPPLNEIFSPTPAEFEQAAAVLDEPRAPSAPTGAAPCSSKAR